MAYISKYTGSQIDQKLDQVDNKVDKIEGKSLSTNDYTTAEKNKLNNIAANANNYSLPVASSSALGGIKSGTDITVDSAGNVSVNNNSHAHTIGNITNLQSTLDGKLNKLDYEWNKELGFGGAGCLYIGRFYVYDSNITIDISSSTSTTYNGRLIIATQNGQIRAKNVYGDASNTMTDSFYIKEEGLLNTSPVTQWLQIYFVPAAWSKNIIKITANGLYGCDESTVCTHVAAKPEDATVQPTNLYDTFIKNTDIATSDTLGIVKPNSDYGTTVSTSGILKIQKASDTDIVEKTQEYKPITPSNFQTALDNHIASTDNFGAVKTDLSFGTGIGNTTKKLYIVKASNEQIDGKAASYNPIVPANLDYAVKEGLANNQLTWTEEEKTKARAAIGAANSSHSHSSYQNQNAFSNIKVGSTTVAADLTTDTLEFVGDGVTITSDATNDKVTFKVTHPSSLPANGGNADTVDNKHASDFATSTHNHNDTYATITTVSGHTGNTSNPHSVTKAQVGLSNVANERQYSSANPPPYPVTKVAGKTGDVSLAKADVGLSNVDNIKQYSSSNPPPYPVISVAGKTGTVTLAKGDVGLGNVDNTSDANKPISTAVQNALNGKANSTHSHSSITGSIADNQINWNASLSGSISPIDAAASSQHNANRFAFAKTAGITIEYSTNNGSTWTTYSGSDASKVRLVSGLGSNLYLGGSSAATKSINNKLRVTLNATSMGVYTRLQKLLINFNTSGATTNVKVEKAMKGSESTFVLFDANKQSYPVSGWSGWNAIYTPCAFGGNSSQTGNVAVLRLTFNITEVNASSASIPALLDISAIGTTYWSYPSELAKTGHLYSYDVDQTAYFPKDIVLGATALGDSYGNSLYKNRVVKGEVVKAYCDAHYLGISAKAADSDKLDGQDGSYYLNYNNLSNKPTIPSVGNGTITIKQNGTSKGTFTTNQTGNTTIELTDDNTVYTHHTQTATTADLYRIGCDAEGHVTFGTKFTIPTVTNDLTNALKANYDAAYTHSTSTHAPTNAEKNIITSIKQNGTALSVGSDRSVNITVPTNTNQLTNGAGFITSADIANKVDKVSGKGLSTNDLTGTLKSNYDAAYTHSTSAHAPSDAEKNVQSDWNQTNTSADDYIKNKPTIPSDTNQKVKVGSSTFGNNDTINFVAGSNVTITADTTNDSITIAATDTKYTHPTTTATSAGLYRVGKDAQGHVVLGSSFTLPSNTNQKIKVGSTTFGDNDVVELVAGTNITLTPDSTNKKITINSTGGSGGSASDADTKTTIEWMDISTSDWGAPNSDGLRKCTLPVDLPVASTAIIKTMCVMSNSSISAPIYQETNAFWGFSSTSGDWELYAHDAFSGKIQYMVYNGNGVGGINDVSITTSVIDSETVDLYITRS